MQTGLALRNADFSSVRNLAIDETSRTRGHDYVTLAADAEARAMLFVTKDRDAETIKRLAEDLRLHGADPEAIDSVSTAPDLKGLRWKLLRDYASLPAASRADVDDLLTCLATRRTARASVYREQLREILDRKQINVVPRLLKQRSTNVMRSKAEPMKGSPR